MRRPAGSRAGTLRPQAIDLDAIESDADLGEQVDDLSHQQSGLRMSGLKLSDIFLQTFGQAVQAAQEVLAPYRKAGESIVDELIRDRRREARGETTRGGKTPRA